VASRVRGSCESTVAVVMTSSRSMGRHRIDTLDSYTHGGILMPRVHIPLVVYQDADQYPTGYVVASCKLPPKEGHGP
jgi:hypothetical protein